MARKASHTTKTKSGTLAHIRIGGRLYRKHFKRGREHLIAEWLTATQIAHGSDHGERTGLFDDDARAYLASVSAMPTYSEREQHIEEWIAVFKDRPRRLITASEIRTQLHAWKTAGKAASTVNHRRTALMHLFTVLDGKSAANPVKDVPKFAEPSPFPRAVSSATMAKLLSKMTGKDMARAMVIAYTGIPHAQLAKIQPPDVNLKAGTVIVHGRRKGKGTAAAVRKLTTKGVEAFKVMKREKAWGPFDRWAFRRAVTAACEAARIHPPLRPYDLRHFFGTEMYRRSGDIRAVQILMDHSTPTLTHRYTLGAVDPRVAAAVKKWR